MELKQPIYPWFEENQVLTPEQLNGVFAYLDEQGRATRANLIGIGIACGLDVSYDAKQATIRLGKGVGVTSEGYLIVEQDPVTLISRRPYTLPPEFGYGPFLAPGGGPETQIALWELLEQAPANGPAGTESLADVRREELAGQAVLLFLELRKDGLRNCSPNACDDLGSEVTATLRRLLIGINDLQGMLDAVPDADRAAAGDLGDRLGLPDLRMPRVDVPNTTLVTSEDVLRAFHQPFRKPDQVGSATVAALSALYRAVKGLVIEEYPSNPFGGLAGRFPFRDRTKDKDVDQVRRLQHHWDHLDDLIAAYDELRWKTIDLLCVCCPPSGLFPRHLMAGLLDASGSGPRAYRHTWRPSPAGTDCEARTDEVRTLFRRLVTMMRSFTTTRLPGELRITPSRWAAPLSAQAIPYYYEQSGNPRLYEVWDAEKTARGRANQNLGYRSDEYAPPAPSFVTGALRYELSPNDFLRVEGHLGRNVWDAMGDVLALRQAHRLPFQVVALRTGAFDEDVEIDLTREQCRFQDLEALYDTLAAELTCFLVKEVEYLYDLPLTYGAKEAKPTAPLLPLLQRSAAQGFTVKAQTVGRWIEDNLDIREGRGKATRPTLTVVRVGVPVGTLVTALQTLAHAVADDVRQLDLAAFEQSYTDIQVAAEALLRLARDQPVKALQVPGLPERLEDILFRCRLAPFQAIADEYRRRLIEAKRAQFLDHFLERHPGIQHKAGVPLGGTFVLVYHEAPKPIRIPGPAFVPRPGTLQDALTRPRLRSAVTPTAIVDSLSQAKRDAIQEALARLPLKRDLAMDSDIQSLYRSLTGNILTPRPPVGDQAATIYTEAVADLPAGTVIADFFLPYPCGSDCGSIVYQLPTPPLRVSATVGCTDDDGNAEVKLRVEGARGKISVQVDGSDVEWLDRPLLLAAVGSPHRVVVQDSDGPRYETIEVTVLQQLKVTVTGTFPDAHAGTYTASFNITGGEPPYTVAPRIDPVDPGVAGSVNVEGGTYTSRPIPIGSSLTVDVIDSARCTAKGFVTLPVQTCDLPCGGDAIREGFRFWLPHPLDEITVDVMKVYTFAIGGADIETFSLAPDPINDVIDHVGRIHERDFEDIVADWLTGINRLVAGEVGSEHWVRLEYEAPTGQGYGTLFIDRLSCLNVLLHLVVEYRFLTARYRYEITIQGGEMTVQDESGESKASLPAFAISTSNKCRPEEPREDHCSETDLRLDIKHQRAAHDTLTFTADSPDPDQLTRHLWEFQGGHPALSDQPEVKVTFHPADPPQKLIRLMVLTKDGCVVQHQSTINVFTDEG